MNLQELIDFHVTGAEACEAYAVTPGASEAKNKDIAKHYTKRAKWHRDAVELMKAGKQRLTVAEKRGGELEGMLRHFALCADVRSVGAAAMSFVAALKPAEEGEGS